MNKAEQTKEHLIQTTVKLLSKGHDPGDLSVRQIADEADITFGLINYHFGTKEHLIQLACSRIVDSIMNSVKHLLYQPDSEPIERLRSFLKYTSYACINYQSVMKVVTRQELMEGQFETVSYLLPIMREIFPRITSENELKLLAFQLLVPIQYAFVRSEQVDKFFGFNIADTASVDWFIDHIINNLLREN